MLNLPIYVKVFTFTVLILTFANTSASEHAKSFLWKIQSDKNSLYLLGSVHMANKSIYPLSKVIKDSFNHSSILAVELNDKKVDLEAMQKLIVAQGMYPADDSIKAHISPKLYRLLQEFLSKNKIPSDNLYQYKPGVLSMILSSIQAKNLGYSEKYGIDRYFINEAELQHKMIVELESMEEQLSLFINMPQESMMLQYTLEELSEMKGEFDALLNIWQSGDDDKLYAITILEPLKKHPELEPIFEKLFFARNRHMADSLVRYLNSNKVYFVVVGAGHLIGNLGILELLRKHYSVKQL